MSASRRMFRTSETWIFLISHKFWAKVRAWEDIYIEPDFCNPYWCLSIEHTYLGLHIPTTSHTEGRRN
jgi:hypothetical protein